MGGIEPIMVEQISFHMNMLVKYWSEYDSTISRMKKLTLKKLYFFSPEYPYKAIHSLIEEEYMQ